jgi:hypothetical protein
MSLSGSATGHLDGAFYGPAAQNVGAVWSLSDGMKSALGHSWPAPRPDPSLAPLTFELAPVVKADRSA